MSIADGYIENDMSRHHYYTKFWIHSERKENL